MMPQRPSGIDLLEATLRQHRREYPTIVMDLMAQYPDDPELQKSGEFYRATRMHALITFGISTALAIAAAGTGMPIALITTASWLLLCFLIWKHWSYSRYEIAKVMGDRLAELQLAPPEFPFRS